MGVAINNKGELKCSANQDYRTRLHGIFVTITNSHENFKSTSIHKCKFVNSGEGSIVIIFSYNLDSQEIFYNQQIPLEIL